MINSSSPLSIQESKQFRRDLKRLHKSGYDLGKLKSILYLLSDGQVLPSVYRNHRLSGVYEGTEECHVGFDWLLIYERSFKDGILRLIRTGTHDILFGK